MQLTAMSVNRSVRALRYRDFRLLLTVQFGRGLSYWMQMTSIPILVLAMGGTTADLGITTALLFGPVLVLAPLVGVAADRVPKRPVLAATQCLVGVQSILFASLATSGIEALPLVFVLTLSFGVAHAVETPFRQSYVAELVPTDDLLNAIGLIQAAFQMTRILGPALAGLLIGVTGVATTFSTGAAMSFVAAALLVAVNARPAATRPRSAHNMTRQLRAAFRHAARNRDIAWSLALVGGVGLLGMTFQPLLPNFAVEQLGGDGRTYGALLSAMGVGAVLAAPAITIARQSSARRRMTMSAVGLGFASILLAVSPFELAAWLAMLLMGYFFITVFGSANQVIQSAVGHRTRGRTMGIYLAINHGGMALGGLLAGILATVIGVPATLIAGGVATGVFGILVFRRLALLTRARSVTQARA